MDYPRSEIFKHLNKNSNYGIGIGRQGLAVGNIEWCLVIITELSVDTNHFRRGGTNIFVLYKYDSINRSPNFDRKMIQQFEAALGLTFLPDHDIERIQEAIALRANPKSLPAEGTLQSLPYDGWDLPETAQEMSGLVDIKTPLGIFGYFTPLDVLDYIYAVLHSPKYREKYSEFLKTDFPRVPWPASPQSSPAVRKQGTDNFWKLVELGSELRQYHLMKHIYSDQVKVTYPVAGDNVVRNKMTKTSPGWISNIKTKIKSKSNVSSSAVENVVELGKVWINENQYFDNVPLSAWEFYIGGYQPAQKWLKDRKDRELTMEDIKHYRKIIKALSETGRLMNAVDEVIKL